MSKCQSNNYHEVRKRIKRQIVFEMVHCNLVIKHVHVCACKCDDLFVSICTYVCAFVVYMCMSAHVVYMSLQQNKLALMSKHIAIGATLCNTF